MSSHNIEMSTSQHSSTRSRDLERFPVDQFFKDVHPDKWSPLAFAQHVSTNHMKEYLFGLRYINKHGTSPINALAGVLNARTKGEAGEASMAAAEAALQLKLAQQMAAAKSVTFQKKVESASIESLINGIQASSSSSDSRKRPLEETGPQALEKKQVLGHANESAVLPLAEAPFNGEGDRKQELDPNVDVVNVAEAGVAFRVESFTFSGRLGDLDLGIPFNQYFGKCAKLKYKKDLFPDFLAINGILFLSDIPTPLQKACFGTAYEEIRRAMMALVPEPSEESIDRTLEEFRQGKDAYSKAMRKKMCARSARKALQDIAITADDTPLRELFLHVCRNLGSKEASPVSEADQTSSYILPMLACIMTKPDECRLAHTANTPTSGSLFVRLCKDLDAPPKHPDLICKHENKIDISFGEVSLTRDPMKDTGDLCRLAIWAKRLQDQLIGSYEGAEEMIVPIFQVVQKTCAIYFTRRVGEICVAVQVGRFDILQDIPNFLQFERHLESWLLLDTVFTELLKKVDQVLQNKRLTSPPKVYGGLCTPSARKLP